MQVGLGVGTAAPGTPVEAWLLSLWQVFRQGPQEGLVAVREPSGVAGREQVATGRAGGHLWAAQEVPLEQAQVPQRGRRKLGLGRTRCALWL